jgi:dTMP kinase
MPFVTFEGIEGSGKSTQARLARAHCADQGWDVQLEREPGGTPSGAAIRQILMDPSHAKLDALAELLLLEADRRQHVLEVLRPALASGRLVLCDRFNDATFAYQGGGRGVPIEILAAVDRWATEALAPHLTLLFDCPVAVGLARARHRDGDLRDRFGDEPADFHERVRAAYLEIARREPGRVRVIDSTRPREDVFADTRRHLDGFLAATCPRS